MSRRTEFGRVLTVRERGNVEGRIEAKQMRDYLTTCADFAFCAETNKIFNLFSSK